VPRLVDRELLAVWKADRRKQAPPLIGDVTRRFDAFGTQLGECGINVITHQVKLMAPVTFSRVNSQLGSVTTSAYGRVTERRPFAVCQ
jgi:hypothetical protein